MGDNKDFMHGIPQFNGLGYDDWQFRVKIHLESKNLWDVLTDDPPTEAASRAEFLKRDKLAKNYLVNFIHSDYLNYVRDDESAKLMWLSLKSAFGKTSIVNQLLLRKQLTKLRMQREDSVASHLLTFENLVRQLKLAGCKMEENDVLTQLFLSLPEKFDPLVTALQNLDDGKLTFSIVKERLKSEELKLIECQEEEDVKETTAFSSKKKGYKK